MYVIHSMERRYSTLIPNPRQPRRALSGLEAGVRIQDKLSQTAFRWAILLARRELTLSVSAMQLDAQVRGTLSDNGVSGLSLTAAAKLNGMRLID